MRSFERSLYFPGGHFGSVYSLIDEIFSDFTLRLLTVEYIFTCEGRDRRTELKCRIFK